MAFYRCGGGGGGDISEIALKGLSEVTNVLVSNLQNKTVTFNCNIGDFILIGNYAINSITGAELIGDTTTANVHIYIYKATNTEVVVRGTGSSSNCTILVNSKTLTDHFSSISNHPTATNQDIDGSNGDVLITNRDYIANFAPILNNSGNFKDLVPIGYYNGLYWYLIKSSSAKFYVSGTYPAAVLHFN